jgi:hypothetical protein
MIRYTPVQGVTKFKDEVNGLTQLRGLSVAPRLIAARTDERIGTVMMERLYGESLLDRVGSLTPDERRTILREVIRIGAALAGKRLCQNDFSIHNLIILGDGSLRMIDYEQVMSHFVRDPFASFQWLASDLIDGTLVSVSERVAWGLVLPAPSVERVGAEQYPELDEAAVFETFGAEAGAVVMDAALTPLPWAKYIDQADRRLPRLATARR